MEEKTKGIHQLTLGSVVGSCHTKLPFPSYWPEFSHRTHPAAWRTENRVFALVTVCDLIMAWWRVDIEEGKPAVSAIVCLSDPRQLSSKYLMN